MQLGTRTRQRLRLIKKILSALQEDAKACADRLGRAVGPCHQQRDDLTVLLAHSGGSTNDTGLVTEVPGTVTRLFKVDRIIVGINSRMERSYLIT